ncbi:nuclear apoptosis-inducing factor 1-like [Acropora millepora]|uniref:nuclear apoptosis-inducing factor 1-like n=1 Tax=Acropora millepora TaxID=45264 RepID=UPI0010FCBF1B|nr:nuclear apoptosis-inducing factor 1-like [Acropora millepora]
MDPEENTGNSGEKRKRKPNFTTRELTIITENVEANKGILQSKFTDNVTNKSKNETWKAITEKVNAVGVASRTTYEVKQKWKGLFSTAKREFSQQKKAQRKTGGGPAPGEPSDTSKLIVEVYDNTPGFSGIIGGFESGDVIAEAQPAVASQADMLETIDMAALEACSAITEPPRKVEQVSGGKRKKKNTQEDLLQLQCETLQLQKETLLLKKRKLELEINKLEMSLGYTT